MSAEHFSGIRHRRGGVVVVIGVVTAVTTALQAPPAAAQSPEAPLDLTCTVTSPGLPAALAVPDVPATLERRPDPREGDATDMGPAPTDPVDSRGELTLRLPAGLGDLLAAHLPGARPSPEGLRINVDIAAEGEATGGEAGGRAAVGDTREVRLAMPGDSAVEPTPALATLAADFTCRVIEEVAPVTPAGPAGFTGPAGVAGPAGFAVPAGFAGPAAPGEPLAELRSEPSSGQLNPAAYQAGGDDSVTSLSSGSGAATPHAPGGQAPTGPQQTVVTPGAASRTTQTSGTGTTTSRSATSTGNSGGTGAGGASTTRSTAADRSATSTSTTSRSTAAASAAASATSATGTSAAAAGSVQQASGSAAGGAAYTVAGAQLLASNSSSSLSSEGDSEFGFHVSLSALLWATGGIIVLSLLYALWTSIRLRRLKAMTADQQLEG